MYERQHHLWKAIPKSWQLFMYRSYFCYRLHMKLITSFIVLPLEDPLYLTVIFLFCPRALTAPFPCYLASCSVGCTVRESCPSPSN